jgi:hypothetical protein
MIMITKLATSLLVQRDDTEIIIDDRAIRAALGAVISELVSDGRALQTARKDAYEAGLNQGYQNAHIAHQTSERIAERQATDLVESLIGFNHANAA